MPKIIDKSLDDFYEEDRRRALQYVPEWRPADKGDFGLALLRIFSHMREEIASRLNRVPEKNFAAFLSMIGTGLSLASPSKVPVTFHPAKGFSQSIFIGAGTQVTTPENERHGILVFEVLRGISLTKAPLSQIFSVDPASDAIYNHTKDHLEERAFSIFQGESLQEHVLFLGEKRLFNLAEGGDVTLEFTSASEKQVPDLSRLSWSCTTENGSEEIEASPPEASPLTFKGKKVFITLKVPKGELKEEEISGRSSIWISCRPESISQSEKISLSRIRVSAVSGGALPDMGFYNFSPIDLSAKKSFHPFGSQPREADAFYVASKEIFSKKGSKITVLFKRNRAKDKEEVKPGDRLDLSFEYWNGHLWKQIPECVDNLNKFQLYAKSDVKSEYEGSIEFSCPEDIEEIDVGGERSFWIRIVLANGDFGREEMKKVEEDISPPAAITKTLKTIWSIDHSKIHPPVLDSIYLEHKTADIQYLDGCIAKNNLEYTDLTSEIRKEDSTYRPFVLMEDTKPAIYLGFEEKLGRGNLSIFFSIDKERREAGLMVRWYYWGSDDRGSGWRSLDASDNTDHLKRSDTIEFLGPAEQRRRSLFGLDIYWLRGVFEGDVTAATKLNWIRPNTTWANQVETIRDEILGSSNGERSQAFGMANFPVISSEVRVLEGKPISEDDKHRLESQGHSVEDVLDSSGKSVDAWVLWTNAPDFYGSIETSRHYQLDSLAGRLLFGDGIRGMIPPAGRENIKASYRIGGGTKGNVSANEISAFRTPIAGVDGVANHEAAEGGSDGESLSSALERGPRMLKSMDRAVTAQDFEALAKASSSSIARTKCLIEENRLTVILIPDSDEDKPMPSGGLIDIVSGYLAKRMAASFSSDDLSIRGPVYFDVSITADVVPTTMEGAAILEKRIVDALKGYLHPLRGGPYGKGWSFGRSVQISDIYALIEGTPGVDHVETLKIEGNAAKISASQMVASGEHRITIKRGHEK